MYQYEFAKRMVAKPKTEDYSRLSANLQLQSEVEILQRIPRKAFYPMPKVDSALVKITLKKEKPPIPIGDFRIITRILFNTKNKLVSAVFYEYFKKLIPKTERIPFKKSLDAIKFSSHRVRELSVNELIIITKELISLLEKEQKITLLK
jgi:16S rRNA A1518/A1519 N6-dimethyltransferase RsmA/KsgA/DIM1 with predicted DNA glycosylase/AP lyase activity